MMEAMFRKNGKPLCLMTITKAFTEQEQRFQLRIDAEARRRIKLEAFLVRLLLSEETPEEMKLKILNFRNEYTKTL